MRADDTQMLRISKRLIRSPDVRRWMCWPIVWHWTPMSALNRNDICGPRFLTFLPSGLCVPIGQIGSISTCICTPRFMNVDGQFFSHADWVSDISNAFVQLQLSIASSNLLTRSDDICVVARSEAIACGGIGTRDASQIPARRRHSPRQGHRVLRFNTMPTLSLSAISVVHTSTDHGASDDSKRCQSESFRRCLHGNCRQSRCHPTLFSLLSHSSYEGGVVQRDANIPPIAMMCRLRLHLSC
jgi:hypothetical protein